MATRKTRAAAGVVAASPEIPEDDNKPDEEELRLRRLAGSDTEFLREDDAGDGEGEETGEGEGEGEEGDDEGTGEGEGEGEGDEAPGGDDVTPPAPAGTDKPWLNGALKEARTDLTQLRDFLSEQTGIAPQEIKRLLTTDPEALKEALLDNPGGVLNQLRQEAENAVEQRVSAVEQRMQTRFINSCKAQAAAHYGADQVNQVMTYLAEQERSNPAVLGFTTRLYHNAPDPVEALYAYGLQLMRVDPAHMGNFIEQEAKTRGTTEAQRQTQAAMRNVRTPGAKVPSPSTGGRAPANPLKKQLGRAQLSGMNEDQLLAEAGRDERD